MDSCNSYLIKVGISTGLLLIFIAGFNALVDPFSFFNSPLIDNFNQEKTEFSSHTRMTKAHQIRLQQPEVIILGSSRAEIGLNPSHSALSSPQDKRYNLGISGANIYEILRYLQHTQSSHPLTQVVLGLDFFMFNVNKQNEADFTEDRLAPMKTGWLLDVMMALLTYDGLQASIKTIDNQNNKTNLQNYSNGFRNDQNYWPKTHLKGGHLQAAVNNEKNAFKDFDGFTFFSLVGTNKQSHSLNTFLQIITFCKKNNIDLKIFISPSHARNMQLMHQIGLWGEREKWKKSIVELLAKNTPDYSLWDFSGYNEITTEPFPPSNDKTTQMQWYWESSHYKKETGDLVLDTLLNYKIAGRKAPTKFGVKLTSKNIEQHLFDQRINRDKFTTSHPEIVNEINDMILNTASKREKLIRQHPELTPIDYFKKPVITKK